MTRESRGVDGYQEVLRTRFGLSGALNKSFQAASSDFTTEKLLSPNECSALPQRGQQGEDCPTGRWMPRGRQGEKNTKQQRAHTRVHLRHQNRSFVKLKLTSLAPETSCFVEPSQSRSLKAFPWARLLRPSKGERHRLCASLCPSRWSEQSTHRQQPHTGLILHRKAPIYIRQPDIYKTPR